MAVDSIPQINLDKIIIQESFKSKLPKAYKIKQCYAYYRKHQKFDRFITLNEKGELTDGYVAYLVAKMLDIKRVPVVLFNSELQKLSTKE